MGKTDASADTLLSRGVHQVYITIKGARRKKYIKEI